MVLGVGDEINGRMDHMIPASDLTPGTRLPSGKPTRRSGR
jgi:hypothetical protein